MSNVLHYPNYPQVFAAILAVTTPFPTPTPAQAAQQVPLAYAGEWLNAYKARCTAQGTGDDDILLSLQQVHGFGIYAIAQQIQNAWAYDRVNVPRWSTPA